MEFNDKIGNWKSEEKQGFKIFVTSLGMQALIFLGEMANPITNETKIELPRAKYLIETISMIKDRTRGNLTDEEGRLIDDMLYTLRLKYAEKTG